ncbi:MAG: DUF4445 domain-containing protein [Candidatus Omnitrophica bacterium]|nr:DUF4445 domain-containing protein [Candidatus Omnitrophota bacterium]MBU4477924.1 DUF4445 domain-containing protein [Candidatus Omnitrophota bacterium]
MMSKKKKKSDSLVKRINFPSGWSLILDNNELLKVEETNQKHVFGLAVDFGTTSVCVSLCNLESREELAASTVTNAQAEYGHDLCSRINFALRGKDNLRLLSEKAVSSLNCGIDECAQKSGVDRQRIFTVVLVGNPILHQILFQLPPDSGPVFNHTGVYQTKAKILGLKVNPDANVRFLPGADSAVGSDILAAILSLRLSKSKKINLCVDMGTSLKIVLGSASKFVIASTAVCSTFEGSLITSGMTAKPGAIEWVKMDKGKIKLLTIGHIRPLGICTSGIIDIISELLREGIIDSSGCLKQGPFLIYKDKKITIEINKDDVKRVQAGKSVICSAIKLLMKKMDIGADSVKKVFISGALGGYLNPENARRIGLVPQDLQQKIVFAGNTAFAGAKLALLSSKAFNEILALSKSVVHVSLAKDKNFEKACAEFLPFPSEPK